MALQDDLLKLVQKASIDGTLTPVAVEYTKKLIDENTALTTQLASKVSELAEVRKVSNDVKKREVEVAMREKEITKLELTAANEKQRVEDHKTMFSAVFRNIDVRRNVFTAVPATQAQGGAYQSGQNAYVQEGQQTETTG